MLKVLESLSTANKGKDDELIALVEAFQFFNRSTTTLNQAYRRLEGAAESLAQELEETNLELQDKNQELDRVNHYLEDILSSIESGVIAADLEGRITIFNRTAEDMTGYLADEVIGLNYEEFFAGENGDQAPLMQTMNSGSPVHGFERELPLKEGGSLPVKCSSTWITSTGGERIGAIETFEDISHVRDLERRMLHQKTLAVLGEMAAQVAHELRNPLAGIKGFASLLSEDIPAENPSHNMVGKIIEGVDSLDRIASNLLILTQDVTGDFERRPLEPIFDQAIELMESRSGGKFKVKRDFPAEAYPAKVDGEKIRQLLLNLLANALEASGGEGKAEAGYRFNALQNEVSLFVRDFGPGVPEEDIDNIFNPFFTTKIQGTGLGLAIAKKIAGIHRGKIEYLTPDEGGAQFNVILPII
ncbi:MAG: two-component system sensor histidine kinase NtrB [Planctomycetota bacterium]|jgi:PAS domain S-box-containing protein